jgi:hypothetical protein
LGENKNKEKALESGILLVCDFGGGVGDGVGV